MAPTGALQNTSTQTFSKAHLSLGDGFFDPVKAADFPECNLRYRNQLAATSVGLDGLSNQEWGAHFGRFRPFDTAQPEPLALRYHGHQFQSYNPDLGDGRGFLFAQLFERDTNRLLDLGTKGSGTTPYSRAGDGRLTLKGAVREALATAFLSALGVSTSKTLSIIETGDQLYRGDEPSPTRSAVLVRLSHSHVRYGTFQRLSFEGNKEALARLVTHCLTHYFPNSAPSGMMEQHSLALLRATIEAKAKTVAAWMAAGFVHGVLNTDNMNITGESFDYGPYRFLPHYDPGFTAAYFDTSGLYAYGRQPGAVAWNLQHLAGTLVPFASQDVLVEELQRYSEHLEREIALAIFKRFGVQAPYCQGDGGIDIEAANSILTDLFNGLRSSKADYQSVFFDHYGGGSGRWQTAQDGPRKESYRNAELSSALQRICEQPIAPDTKPTNGNDEVPNLLYDQIEAIWSAIAQDDDWSLFDAKLAQFRALGGVA